MNQLRYLASALLVSSLVMGCASDASLDPNDPESASEADLTKTAQKLAGSYAFDVGSSSRAFTGLVLRQDGTFFADISEICRTTTCNGGRIEGTFSATATSISLKPKAGATAVETRNAYFGKYRYSVDAVGPATAISLTRDGAPWSAWSNTLSKETSYCQTSSDCFTQSIITPACRKLSFTCETQTCKWSCSGR
jgi:hypothetical protein